MDLSGTSLEIGRKYHAPQVLWIFPNDLSNGRNSCHTAVGYRGRAV